MKYVQGQQKHQNDVLDVFLLLTLKSISLVLCSIIIYGYIIYSFILALSLHQAWNGTKLSPESEFTSYCTSRRTT